MIHQLNIKNFKSIKDLSISCKKLNIFIGEPNSGKSNIIEAMSLQSQNAFNNESMNQEIFRFETVGDLFYDFNINEPIEVNTGEKHSILNYPINDDGTIPNQFNFQFDTNQDKPTLLKISHDGKVASYNFFSESTLLHFYEYKRILKFQMSYLPHLSVPFGENLPSLLLSNPEYKKWVSDFLISKGLNLTFKPNENQILVSKFVNNEIYSYPYFTLSETLQRIIFYNMAIMSNKDSVILLDEPESNTFPFYTKFLAERIALDKTNQFFITTHNPYLLLSLIEKSGEKDINVCIVQMKDYQTTATVLSSCQMSEVLDLNSDVFFNFDKILGL